MEPWIALSTALAVLLNTIILFVSSRRAAANNTKRDGQLENIKMVAYQTHFLVNSKMAVQLQINADLARVVYNQAQQIFDLTQASEDKEMLVQAKIAWDSAKANLSTQLTRQSESDAASAHVLDKKG